MYTYIYIYIYIHIYLSSYLYTFISDSPTEGYRQSLRPRDRKQDGRAAALSRGDLAGSGSG